MEFPIKEMYNKSYNKSYNEDGHNLRYIFPYLKNKELYKYLKIDNESLYYISHKNISLKITNIIIENLEKYKIKKEDLIITDCTGGVGGDTIQFAQTFRYVYSIEIDKNRFNYLNNNLNIYGSKNVKIFNDDFLNILPIIPNHHVVFIDPPWGGSDYKNLKNIRLKISNKYELEDLCEMILLNNIKKNPLFICLKLPKNYDIKYMYRKLNKCSIYLYELNKMIIIIIEKKDITKLNIFVDKFIKNIISNSILNAIQINQTQSI